MTPKIALACLFILPLTIFCQEVVVEHLGYQGITNNQKEFYSEQDEIIRNSFNQAKIFLDENTDCGTVKQCEQLLQEANNLIDYYENKNLEAQIARDKINRRIDAMNTYYENIGVGAHLKHDEIYEYNQKTYLRYLKAKKGGFKFKLNLLKNKNKTRSVTLADNDFWNGKTKAKQSSKLSTNQTSISESELEIIEGGENLRRKGSNDLVFPEGRFTMFRKFGEYFIGQERVTTKNNKWENIKRYNRNYLFDKKGNVLLKSIRRFYFDESKTEIHAETYESIVYSHSVSGGMFSDALYYRVKNKIEIYDLEMNLKGIEKNTYDIKREQL